MSSRKDPVKEISLYIVVPVTSTCILSPEGAVCNETMHIFFSRHGNGETGNVVVQKSAVVTCRYFFGNGKKMMLKFINNCECNRAIGRVSCSVMVFHCHECQTSHREDQWSETVIRPGWLKITKISHSVVLHISCLHKRVCFPNISIGRISRPHLWCAL